MADEGGAVEDIVDAGFEDVAGLYLVCSVSNGSESCPAPPPGLHLHGLVGQAYQLLQGAGREGESLWHSAPAAVRRRVLRHGRSSYRWAVASNRCVDGNNGGRGTAGTSLGPETGWWMKED